MKRLLLSAILATQFAWAAPLPTEQPGVFLAPASYQKQLQEAENVYRKRHDRWGLFEVECRRLELLLPQRDSSCPLLWTQLKARSTDLPPGPVRARFYWVAGLYAGCVSNSLEQQRFQQMAVDEPGLPALQRAHWLCRRSSSSLEPVTRSQIVKKLRALYEGEGDSRVLWYLLGAQIDDAEGKAQEDLTRSLLLARLQLAEKEKWPLEQATLLSRICQTPQDRLDQQAWRLIQATSPSTVRDEMIKATLLNSKDDQDFQRRTAALKTPLPAAELLARRLRWQVKRSPVTHERFCELQAALVRAYQRSGEIDKEIEARYWLSLELNGRGKLKDALRQARVALQMRLEHPVSDPAFPRPTLGALSGAIAFLLQNHNLPYQALDFLQTAMAEGRLGDLSDRARLSRTAMDLSLMVGDVPAYEKYWLDLLNLSPQLPLSERVHLVEDLARKIPPSQALRRGELNQKARELAESQLLSSRGTHEHQLALLAMSNLLNRQKDRVGAIEMWRSELHRAREVGDRHNERFAAHQLTAFLGSSTSPQEAQELAETGQSLLQSGDVSAEGRSDILRYCVNLAQNSVPLALAWADEYVRLNPKGPAAGDAVYRRARVLRYFKRPEEALRALDEADWSQEDRFLRPYQVDELRAELLAELGRTDEAIVVLKRGIERLLASEQPSDTLHLIRLTATFGKEDWQQVMAQGLQTYDRLGEAGQDARHTLLAHWLERLARAQRWADGREVLARFPWKASSLDRRTRELQAYPEWADLLPPPLQPVAEPTDLKAILDELRLGRPDLAPLITLRSTNVKHLQSRLRPNETLVTYCTLGDSFYLLALRCDGGFFRRSQLNAEQLKNLQQRYLTGLRRQGRGEAEQSLHTLLLAPVLRDMPDQRLLLAPTGDLWQLPFGALRDEKGNSAASQSDLVLLGSADLLRLADNSWQPYRIFRPLAIGAPPKADLPGAYEELGEISALLPGCQLRRGPDATLDSLNHPDQNWGLLHFAGHAQFRKERPTESQIDLADGVLKVKHFSQIPLADRSLVVLSCCQGGTATGQSLDEPITLATGFSAAGAETVVANLWPIDDQVARQFFSVFYQHLATGASPLESFRQAQQGCRKLYPDPRDWAGFFLLGNPT